MASTDDNPVDENALAAEWAEALAGDDEAPSSKPRRLSISSWLRTRAMAAGGAGSMASVGGAGSGVQAIVNSALVSYERLPMLEVVFDRLVRLMSTSLRHFTSENVEVSLDSVASVRFGDYLNGIPLPAMLAVVKAVEWENYGLITIDSPLIYSIVDVLLGGRRGTAAMRIEGRPYTTIERSLVERMVGAVLADLDGAFEPISEVSFKFERLETNPASRRFRGRRMRRSSPGCASTWTIAAVTWSCCCRTRRWSRCANSSCRCSWAKSSAATPSGRRTSPASCGRRKSS